MVVVNGKSANSSWEPKVKHLFFWPMHYDLRYRLGQSFLSNSLEGKSKELEMMPTTAEPVL